MTPTKEFLSGSTNGKQIKIVATATPGTLLHTAVTGTVNKDEIYLYVTNNHTAAVNLTIEWGGVASPDDLIQQSIPPKSGKYLIVPGECLNNALVTRAFASVANVLCIGGWANRIVP